MKKTLFILLLFTLVSCSLLKNRVSTPTFNPGTGIYTNSVTVSVNCLTPDAIIYVKRYVTFHTNTDLNLPPAVTVSDNWVEYSAPLTFRTNTYLVTRVTLSAYAEKEGMETSSTNSAIYELRK
ncbi:MAG: hypothetical protein N2258_00740 [Brevinematales bacterium]|nr:hypothetical protein [Brevinematales bacterium]